MPAPYGLISSIHLAHFPARSLEQIKKKILINWLSKLANPLHESGRLQNGKIPIEHHWKNLFDLLKDDITEEQAMNAVREVYMRGKDLGLTYSPVSNNDTIKYEISKLSTLSLLATAAEQQAVALQKANQFIINITQGIKDLGTI